jgi:hypothetical protein
VVSGAVVRLRVLEHTPGVADDQYFVYTVNRRTGRVIAQTGDKLTTRWRVLPRAPRLVAPAPICAAA